ncbi:response regulator [Candidatus Parcubacteria bacterium]|nr:response regulator [Candidatus Parcubacteria bacterium]
MRILVVEDDAKHLADAEKFFASQVGVKVVCYARNLEEAWQYLDREKVDGVISDVYFPASDLYRSTEAFGVAVLIACTERKIPCVLNTAGYHHGDKYEWITRLVRTLKFPEIVDASRDRHAEAETKNWERALRALKEQLG